MPMQYLMIRIRLQNIKTETSSSLTLDTIYNIISELVEKTKLLDCQELLEPTLFILSEDLKRLRLTAPLENCQLIIKESDIPSECKTAVLIHIRNIIYGCGTEVLLSRTSKYPIHLLNLVSTFMNGLYFTTSTW